MPSGNLHIAANNVYIVFAFNTGFCGVDIKGAVGDDESVSGVNTRFVGALHRQTAFPGEGQVRGGVDGRVRVICAFSSIVSPIRNGVCRARSGVNNRFTSARHINGWPG